MKGLPSRILTSLGEKKTSGWDYELISEWNRGKYYRLFRPKGVFSPLIYRFVKMSVRNKFIDRTDVLGRIFYYWFVYKEVEEEQGGFVLTGILNLT